MSREEGDLTAALYLTSIIRRSLAVDFIRLIKAALARKFPYSTDAPTSSKSALLSLAAVRGTQGHDVKVSKVSKTKRMILRVFLQKAGDLGATECASSYARTDSS
jgi:hypothetical protein